MSAPVYPSNLPERRQDPRSSFLRQWWPALAGVAVLAAVGAMIGWSALDEEPSGSTIISAVPMLAQIADVNDPASGTGEIELEFNNGSGEVCHRVSTASLVTPFNVTLHSASAQVLDLGTHTTGTMGCTPWTRQGAQGVLASPETHFVELHNGDGTVLRGSLAWNPDSRVIASRPTTDTTEGEQPTESPTTDGALKAGFIMPDTTSSTRWEEFDKPLILAACDEAGIECTVDNAEGDPAMMASIARDMVADGIGVLAIAAIDSESGAEIQREAAAAGVKNIDYDRLTVGGMADVYVSFDNVAVGSEEANGLVQCLGDDTDGRRIIVLHGSPTDNNATLVKEGYEAVVAGTGFEVVGEAAVPDWDPTQARVLFEGLLAEAGNDIDGVLAANDGMSLAAQSVLQEQGLQVPTTGQDATAESLRALLSGDQCVTIYKPIEVEADSVVDAAVALLRGTDPPANATIADGDRQIPFVQAAVTPVFRDQVAVPIQDGFVDRDAVCDGIEDLCQAAGIG